MPVMSHKNEQHYGWVPMAHTCNPLYSGGRDQEDHSLKSAQANSSQDPISKKKKKKKTFTKKG
jgi:hypothetical protein